MKKNYILLEEWAKKNKVSPMTAKNWARRGKLKTAKLAYCKIKRWIISADESPKVGDKI